MAKNYPIIEKHQISYSRAYELIKICQKVHPEVSKKTLNYFKWPLPLYNEMCQAYDENCFAQICLGWDDQAKGGPCFVPLMFVSNEAGRLMPPPESTEDEEDPMVLDVASLCPPLCIGDDSELPVPKK